MTCKFIQMALEKLCECSLLLQHIDGLMQERRNSIANALELCLSCTNPSTCDVSAVSTMKGNSYAGKTCFALIAHLYSFLQATTSSTNVDE